MGAWGPGLFSDDAAADIRVEYLMMLGDGVDAIEATDRLLREHDVSDPDSGPVFWLALADTQWRFGRLEPRVKDAALRVIDDGSDLERWRESPDLARRRRILQKLRAKLQTPPPAPRRVKKVFRDTCDWAVGEIIAYRLSSGRLVLFRVIGYHTDLGGTSPIVDVLDWTGRDVPSGDTIDDLPRRMPNDILARRGYEALGIFAANAREFPSGRVIRTGITSLPAGRVITGEAARRDDVRIGWLTALWRNLEETLQRDFGLV